MSVELVAPPAIIVTVDPVNINCYGASTGEIPSVLQVE
jgi:hypothetical protein